MDVKTLFWQKHFYCLGYTNLAVCVNFKRWTQLFLSFRELFSPSQKYQLLVYHADAIFHDKEYRNAACKYNMALQQKKVLSKTSKVRPSSTGGTTSAVQAQVSSTKPSSSPLHTFTMVHIHWNTMVWYISTNCSVFCLGLITSVCIIK